MTDADNIVWKTVCLVHITVVLVGTVYVSIVVIQLMLQQMKNPLRYEEGRSVYVWILFISSSNVQLIGFHPPNSGCSLPNENSYGDRCQFLVKPVDPEQ